MSIATSVENYLTSQDTPYELLAHPESYNSLHCAHSAHITPSQLAKAVIVTDNEIFMTCIIPASHLLVLKWLSQDYRRHFRLATEAELERLYPDCHLGAVPPLGQAYGMDVVWDDSLSFMNVIYMEGGDHKNLIRLTHDDFLTLMTPYSHGAISCDSDSIEFYQYLH